MANVTVVINEHEHLLWQGRVYDPGESVDIPEEFVAQLVEVGTANPVGSIANPEDSSPTGMSGPQGDGVSGPQGVPSGDVAVPEAETESEAVAGVPSGDVAVPKVPKVPKRKR